MAYELGVWSDIKLSEGLEAFVICVCECVKNMTMKLRYVDVP